MTKTTLNTLTALAVAATLTLSLAACSSEKMFPPIFDEASATPAATQEPVLDPLDLDGNGMVSEREKELAAKNAVRDYTLPDGTVVQVDPTQPLPEPVRAAVQAASAPLVAEAHVMNAERAKLDVFRALDAHAAATGRGVLFVYSGESYGEGVIWVPIASGYNQAIFQGTTDKAAVVAQAETWAANHNYELIVY